MAKVEIFDADGNGILREAIDARECVAGGSYSYASPVDAGAGEEVAGDEAAGDDAKTKPAINKK